MSYKISIWIVLFLLFFNGGAVMLEESAAADYLGVNPAVGDNEQLDKAKQEAQKYGTGTGGGQTLFGLWNSLSNVLQTVVDSIFPAATMMRNVGVPNYIVTYFFTGISIVPGIDVIMFLRSG